MPFEASQAIFRSLSSQKNRNCPKCCLQVKHYLLAFVPDAKLQLLKFRHAQQAKFAPSTLPFTFSPPRFFCFSFPVFFSFVGHLLGFLSVGKGFAKSPRIVKFSSRKYKWVRSGTRFSAEFSGQSYMMVFCVFLWPVWLNHTHLGMAWKISSPCTSLLSKLSRTVKTDVVQVVQGTWLNIRAVTGSSGVNVLNVQVVNKSTSFFIAYTLIDRWDKNQWEVLSLKFLPLQWHAIQLQYYICKMNLIFFYLHLYKRSCCCAINNIIRLLGIACFTFLLFFLNIKLYNTFWSYVALPLDIKL